MRQRHRQDGVTGLQERAVGGEVGAGAGVRLQVGVLGPEQLLGPLDADLLGLVDDGAAAVVAAAGIALGVLVGQRASRARRAPPGEVKFSLAISCRPQRSRSSSSRTTPAISGSWAPARRSPGPRRVAHDGCSVGRAGRRVTRACAAVVRHDRAHSADRDDHAERSTRARPRAAPGAPAPVTSTMVGRRAGARAAVEVDLDRRHRAARRLCGRGGGLAGAVGARNGHRAGRPSSSSATGCSGIRSATVPLGVAEVPGQRRRVAQTRVSAPGQNASTSSRRVRTVDREAVEGRRCRPGRAPARRGRGPSPRAGRPPRRA